MKIEEVLIKLHKKLNEDLDAVRINLQAQIDKQNEFLDNFKQHQDERVKAVLDAFYETNNKSIEQLNQIKQKLDNQEPEIKSFKSEVEKLKEDIEKNQNKTLKEKTEHLASDEELKNKFNEANSKYENINTKLTEVQGNLERLDYALQERAKNELTTDEFIEILKDKKL